MAIDSKDAQLIRTLIPLATLPVTRFEALCRTAHVEEATRGTILFRQGDPSPEFVYLLSGKVALQAGEVEMDAVEAGSETARFALAHQIPRKVSAIARSRVRFIRVDPGFLQAAEEKNEAAIGYDVSDIPQESSEDWMTALLRLPLFQRIPATHLQKILIEMQEMRVKTGRRILVQGEPNDHFFVIKEGGCTISRKPSKQARDIVIARLTTGDTLGEDALLSGQPCQASATMSSDGLLLRLERERFLHSIKETVIHSIGAEAALQEGENQHVLLDVRPPEEFERSHLRGSINRPLFSLPMQIAKLDKKRPHIVICHDNTLSETATFLLIKNGFEAVVLKDGLRNVADDALEETTPSKSANKHNRPVARPSTSTATTGNNCGSTSQGAANNDKNRRAEDRPPQTRNSEQRPAVERKATTRPGTASTGRSDALQNRVKVLEGENKQLVQRLEQTRRKATASLRTLQQRLQTAEAECTSLAEQLREKERTIAQLQATLRATQGEQPTPRQATAATDDARDTLELEPLPPNQAATG